MSDDEVCRVLDVVRRDARCPSVSFTGGEPTLRAGLPRLVRHAKDLGLRVNLISNGQRLDDARVGELADAGLDSAQLSLEGPSADVHDALVGKPGAFDRLWAGLERLRARGVRVHTNTTLSRRNAPLVEAIVDLVAGRGLERLTMNLVIPCGTAGTDESLPLRYSDAGAIVERARARASRARRRARLVLAAAPVPLQHRRRGPRQPRLRGGRRASPRRPGRRRAAVLELRPWREPRQPAPPAVRRGVAVAGRALLPREADDARALPRLLRARRSARALASSTGGRRASRSWADAPPTARRCPPASPDRGPRAPVGLARPTVRESGARATRALNKRAVLHDRDEVRRRLDCLRGPPARRGAAGAAGAVPQAGRGHVGAPEGDGHAARGRARRGRAQGRVRRPARGDPAGAREGRARPGARRAGAQATARPHRRRSSTSCAPTTPPSTRSRS